MIRRRRRRLIPAMCLLSLLVCFAMTWLWAQAAYGSGVRVELAAWGVYVRAESHFPYLFSGRWSCLDLQVIFKWPGAAEAHVARLHNSWRFSDPNPDYEIGWVGGRGRRGDGPVEVGRVYVHLGTDGTPVRPDSGKPLRSYSAGLPSMWIRDIPLALVVVGFALPPAVWVGGAVRRRVDRRRELRRGRCARCGYDLRATPERCPECGAVPVGTKRNVRVGAAE